MSLLIDGGESVEKMSSTKWYVTNLSFFLFLCSPIILTLRTLETLSSLFTISVHTHICVLYVLTHIYVFNTHIICVCVYR